jgi:hypothetical protein
MPPDKMIERNSRKYAGISEKDIVYKDVSERQKQMFLDRKKELSNIENLLYV